MHGTGLTELLMDYHYIIIKTIELLIARFADVASSCIEIICRAKAYLYSVYIVLEIRGSLMKTNQ